MLLGNTEMEMKLFFLGAIVDVSAVLQKPLTAVHLNFFNIIVLSFGRNFKVL